MKMFLKFRTWVERAMVAVSFAEAGCPDIARSVMSEAEASNRRPTARIKATNDQRPVLRI